MRFQTDGNRFRSRSFIPLLTFYPFPPHHHLPIHVLLTCQTPPCHYRSLSFSKRGEEAGQGRAGQMLAAGGWCGLVSCDVCGCGVLYCGVHGRGMCIEWIGVCGQCVACSSVQRSPHSVLLLLTASSSHPSHPSSPHSPTRDLAHTLQSSTDYPTIHSLQPSLNNTRWVIVASCSLLVSSAVSLCLVSCGRKLLEQRSL